jgi:Ca-activated chloride channel homolog
MESSMKTLQFAQPWVLALLWMVPLAAVLLSAAARRRAAALDAFASSAMRRRLAPNESSLRERVQAVLLLTGMALSLVALAGPRWGETEQRVFQRGRDLVIALDVSRSMLATDVAPNRLDRAPHGSSRPAGPLPRRPRRAGALPP